MNDFPKGKRDSAIAQNTKNSGVAKSEKEKQREFALSESKEMGDHGPPHMV